MHSFSRPVFAHPSAVCKFSLRARNALHLLAATAVAPDLHFHTAHSLPPAFVQVRIVNDATFGLGPADQGCGWHVDDKVFWPTEDVLPGDGPVGVFVWVTLSPINASVGGGLAIANGSASARWRDACRRVIESKDERGYPQTCNMESVSPECHRRMEEARVDFDMQPGDAIVLSRYTFHKGVPFQQGELKARCAILV
jgi:hypothetical protein